MSQININRISYNDTQGSFEARVDIVRDGATFRYPCAVPGPRSMPMADVESSLAARARSMSDTPLGL